MAAVTSAGESTPEAGQTDSKKWQALAVCLVAGFMTLLDVSIVNVALPAIRTGLDVSSSDLQWIVAGYTLTFGLALVPAGRLGDARSRRMVFVVGVVIFTVASGVTGAATSALMLTIARLVQGIGGGLITPQIAGFIQTLFEPKERGKAFGIFGSVIGISTAIGPLVGGLLIKVFGESEGWRWVFYINLPIGIVALVLAFKLLPKDAGSGNSKLDPIGTLLLAGATLLVLLPLVTGSQGSLSDRPWWLLAPAAVLLVLFVVWEDRLGKRGGAPVINLSLFKFRSYSLGTGLILAHFAGFTSIFLVTTLFLQSGEKFSALEAGVASLPFAIGFAASSATAGRLVPRFGRPIVVAGLVLVVIGLVGLDVVVSTVDTHIGWAMALPFLVAGLGNGMVISPNQALTLSQVPPRDGGSAAGVVQTAQRIGSSIGVAFVTAVFFTKVASSRGDYGEALSLGLRATIAFVAVALVLGLFDLLPHRRIGKHEA